MARLILLTFVRNSSSRKVLRQEPVKVASECEYGICWYLRLSYFLSFLPSRSVKIYSSSAYVYASIRAIFKSAASR
jgi:hypothetical protein